MSPGDTVLKCRWKGSAREPGMTASGTQGHASQASQKSRKIRTFTGRGGWNIAFCTAFIKQPLTNSACCTEVPHTVNTHLKIGPTPSRVMFLVCTLACFKVKQNSIYLAVKWHIFGTILMNRSLPCGYYFLQKIDYSKEITRAGCFLICSNSRENKHREKQTNKQRTLFSTLLPPHQLLFLQEGEPIRFWQD